MLILLTALQHRILASFSGFETVIDRQQLIFKMTHPAINAPDVSVLNAGTRPGPSGSLFGGPSISVDPVIAPGGALHVTGQNFPLNINMTNTVPVGISGGGSCFGGRTDIRVIAGNTVLRTDSLPGDSQGNCQKRYDAVNLKPATVYQFQARVCDFITCSRWSQPARVMTDPPGAQKGRIALTIDGPAPLRLMGRRPLRAHSLWASPSRMLRGRLQQRSRFRQAWRRAPISSAPPALAYMPKHHLP